MAMNPGMKMMLVDRNRNRTENNSRSEYGGNRRMIGYDRETNGNAATSNYGDGYRGGGNTAYVNYGNPLGYPSMAYSPYGAMAAVPQYANNYGIVEGPRVDTPGNEEVRRMGSREGTEARRRRDSRGRYMMNDSEWDDDEEDHHHGQHMMGSASSMSQPVDEHTARRWVKQMDGGEHFKVEQSESLRHAICPDCEKWEFYVAINAMHSDYGETARKMNIDKPDYFAYLAKDFLCDRDAGPNKLRKYMETIPK